MAEREEAMTDSAAPISAAPIVVGRYVLHAPIARGGMATIHLARLLGAEGFSRTVAAKRLHPQFTEDAEFLRMFLDEARIASKVRHPNVVPMLDVIQMGTEVILVQEYVHGISFDKLLRAANQQKKVVPVNIVVAVVAGMLAGLYAAHEAKDELGESLNIVHRDVSLQNVLVGVDGMPRLLDFGVAKASVNMNVTRTGVFKGKLVYASPEQLRGTVTRATDIYSSAVALWEALAGRRPYSGLSEAELITAVSSGAAQKLTDAVDMTTVSPERWKLLQQLEPVVSKGMAFDAKDRYATAAEMQEALLQAAPAATAAEVSKWVKQLGKKYLEAREQLMVSEESTWRQRSNSTSMSIEELADRPPPASQPGTVAATLRASVLVPTPERRRVEWAIVSALLLIGALLAGIIVLLLRKSPDPTAVAGPAPPEASPTLAATAQGSTDVAPTPTASAAVSAGVGDSTDTSAQPTVSARASRQAPAPPRVVAPRVVAPRVVAPRVTAPAAPAAPPPTAPTNDCKTPFYFDGKKKIFKPGCL
jgi:eukaryotic-like serine/threonine-protein kinase